MSDAYYDPEVAPGWGLRTVRMQPVRCSNDADVITMEPFVDGEEIAVERWGADAGQNRCYKREPLARWVREHRVTPFRGELSDEDRRLILEGEVRADEPGAADPPPRNLEERVAQEIDRIFRSVPRLPTSYSRAVIEYERNRPGSQGGLRPDDEFRTAVMNALQHDDRIDHAVEPPRTRNYVRGSLNDEISTIVQEVRRRYNLDADAPITYAQAIEEYEREENAEAAAGRGRNGLDVIIGFMYWLYHDPRVTH